MSLYPDATSQSHVWVPILAEKQRGAKKGEEREVLDYVLAKIDHYEGDELFVTSDTHGRMSVDRHKTQQYDRSHSLDQPDIGNMNNLAIGPLLDVLRRRYNEDKIYTWTGKILISFNPYFIIPGLYDIPPVRQDIDNGKEAFREDPHVFTVAERAYCDLLGSPTNRNQSLIVSGESGAGKTEACKRVMNMLAEISKSILAKEFAAIPENKAIVLMGGTIKPMADQHDGIEAKVLGCNPFLEAFGNAKTNRNDNSSRFGKFLKIEYDQGKIIGAHMKQYLLEKSRVIDPGPDERSYHIFYQLILGCKDEDREDLCLLGIQDYHFLNRSGCFQVEGMDDVKEFQEVCESFETVGIDETMQKDIFRVVSAILTLGNVTFGEKEHEASGNMIATVESSDEIAIVAKLISCPDVQMNLLQRQVRAGGGGGRRQSVTIVKMNRLQAVEACEALAKHLYGNMFGFLVTKVNSLLETGGKSDRFIGILDIFGFEIFEKNSFEQLCINYTNEKLQNLFNHHVFTLEEEQYKAEGVDFSSVAIRDNTDCVRLIESKPHGILIQLDQICRVGRSSLDIDYLKKLDKSWGGKIKDKKLEGQASYYMKPKVRREDNGTDKLFTIVHFAGPVHYCVDHFLEKNKDALHGDLEFMCENSESEFVRSLFRKESSGAPAAKQSKRGGGGGGARRMTKMPATIAVKFKDQLVSLNKELLKTDPHYIRCIKPNASKGIHDYTSDMVLRQLIYSGVLETVRIRREGFPFRKSFKEFWNMCLAEGFDKLATIPPNTNPKNSTRLMLKAVFDDLEEMKNVWQLGHTKVFLKDAAYEFLQDFKRKRIALQLQTWWRCAFPSKYYRRAKRVAIMLQKVTRRLIFAKKFASLSSQTLKIQSSWRRKMAYKKIARKRAAVAIVAAQKAEVERIRIEKEQVEQERREQLEREREQMKSASTVMSCSFRSWKARQELKKRIKKRNNFLLLLTESATKVQAQYRGHRRRLVWFRLLGAALVINEFARRCNLKRRARRQRAAIILFQCLVRTFIQARVYRRQKRGCIRMQTIVRMFAHRKVFLAQIWAVGRIKTAYQTFQRNTAMSNWVEEVYTMVEVGDDGYVEDLLEFHEDVEEYNAIKDVRSNAANIRHAPSFATLLHSAAKTETASPVLLELCVEAGAILDQNIKRKGRTLYWCAKDVNSNTPLHIVAALGDRYLSIAAQLLEFSANKIRFLNHENTMGATALDVAIDNALSASSTTSEEFTGLIKWMFVSGGASMLYGSKADVDVMLADLDAGQRRMDEIAAAREARRAAVEKDKLKQTTAYKLAEIRSNEGERKRKAEADKIKAAELAIQEAKEKKQREHEERIAAELAHAVSTCGVEGGWKFHLHFVVLISFFFFFFFFSLFPQTETTTNVPTSRSQRSSAC